MSIFNRNKAKTDEQNAIDEPEQNKQVKKSIFSKLKEGLSKTRNDLSGKIEGLFKFHNDIDDDFYDDLEEILITSDVGVKTSMQIIEDLKSGVKEQKIKEPEKVKDLLADILIKMLVNDNGYQDFKKPTVLLVVGVNGVGKTTTIGKISHIMKGKNKNVILAAADTFRAAAAEQLEIWGERAGVPVVRHNEGADPAAVIFDAIQSAKAKNADMLICDTAGRLHNKKNLMEELKKIRHVIDRDYSEADVQVYLVIDASTGQNGITQAKIFKEVTGIDGIVLTKLDGTAKGGVVVSIKSELGVPVKFIGVGEGIDDLQEFNAEDFVAALFS